MIGVSPYQRGEARARWWLAGIRQHITWLHGKALSTVWRCLRRLEVVYKRGRRTVHSPDPDYDRKLAEVAQRLLQVRLEPQRWVLLYQDELTYYRRPTVAQGYARRGSAAPRAWQGWGSNTRRRIAAVMDVQTGQVLLEHHARAGRQELIALYRQVETTYPQAERIFIVQDNWPVHFHADIRSALLKTRITLVFLPTYAPWTNPIEKLWRWLYQDVLHLHSWAQDWSGLQTAVSAWLSQFHHGSLDLLHYVGLYPF
ncbi:MAG: IS630 family transposase [Gammaproteobacteria bacterium]